ncbi:MAG: glycerol-3-phosphate dehydrogenase/oxidase [Bacteroidales bacterium]|nr:glycerol-3-phosphate dehydrogenase/oxidase [Bacteroidales bacterium]
MRSADRPWDILVIGGGATGMGTALDAASRGYRTLLLEQHDFGKGTSSRSTKLVHGGVRYLRQGDVSLVFEALKERGLMLQNAPHLVRNQSFIIPAYDWWEGPFYTVGLKVYDVMAGRMGLGPSRHITREETIEALPNIEREGLKGGIIYHDGQFDDARMLVSLARTCEQYGGFTANYMKVTGLIKEKSLVAGVLAIDEETAEEYRIEARVVINATGVFADDILKMDTPGSPDMIRPSQGIHLVLGQDFLKGKHAIMVPHTSDGRVMFAVPWYNRVVLGTTDTLIDYTSLEPCPIEEEIDFVLETAGQYLVKKPGRSDVLSAFAGLRPLAAPENEGKSTKEISRHHKVMVSVSGLISVIGGKWTTYRKMAEDSVDYAIMVGELPERPCLTGNIQIHGYTTGIGNQISPMSVYGNESSEIEKMKVPGEQIWLSESLKILKSQVIWAARKEMARTLEDVLARRTRALFLDARESLKIAPEAAGLLVGELGKDQVWVKEQLSNYEELAKNYMVNG